MAFNVRSWWSAVAGSGGTRRPPATPDGEHNFLPQDSVIISDRKKHANKLGEGSFAKVFRGEYNGKPCAVKVFKVDKVKKELPPEPGGTSEVELLWKVQHTNIVKMYGIWFDPYKGREAPSIVMELCDESLCDFIKGKIVPEEKKLRILQDIARGMVYLHRQNIVHGDLRSSNVLLCHSMDQTVAKLADFDMARLLDIDTQHHFTDMFTAEEYLPPEVFDHKEHKDQKKKWARLTPKVDVFCFGELVLEMGCGTYPTPTGKFRGRQLLTELERREKHLAKLKQSDKESLGSIIQKCLVDAPEGRPSFTEILLEVEGYLHKYGDRPDLEVLQDKTVECEALRAEAVKWKGEVESLSSIHSVLKRELEKERAELENEKAEKQDLQINLQIQQTRVKELQQKIQRKRDAAEESFTMSTKLQVSLEAEKEKLCNAEETIRQKEKELEKCKDDLQAERDRVRTMEKAALQKDKELDQCKGKLRRHEQLRDALKLEKADLLTMNTKLSLQVQQQANERASEEQHVDRKAITRLQEEISQLKRQHTDENMKLIDEVAKYRAQESVLKQRLEQKQRELSEMAAKRDSLDAQLVTVNEEKRALLSTECELTSKMRKMDNRRGEILALEREVDQLKERLSGARKTEQTLNDQLRQYRVKLKTTEDKFEQSKVALEEEVAARDKQVRELTTELAVRNRDLHKNEKELFTTKTALLDAQAAVEKGTSLEPILRQKIDELENEKREHMDELEETGGILKKVRKKFTEAMNTQNALEHEREQQDETIRELEDKLMDVQRREQDLNDQLQLCHDQLEAIKGDLQSERDKVRTMEEAALQKEKELDQCKGDLQSERDKVQTMEVAALQKERELDQCKARKAVVEKDLVRARKKAKDLLDERVVVNTESEQKGENLNEKLMKFKQQAVLSEERLKQVPGLEGEHHDLKIQLKMLTTTLEEFQKGLTDEQKSRKSLDASIKALTAEIDQLRTELKERDNEVSSLTADNKHLQRKVDAADANSGEMKAEITQLRTELKERDNEVSSLTAANGGLQRKVDAADADITDMKAKSTSLKEQVKALSNDKMSLEQTLDAAEAAIQRHKNDHEDCQEKLREAEQQVALFQGKWQQLKVAESVAVELKTRLSGLLMDAPSSLTPSVGGGKDGSSATTNSIYMDALPFLTPSVGSEEDETSTTVLTQEAAQKVQQLERERDSLKAERHMYHMKWLATEDMLEAVKNDRQSLQDERDSLLRIKDTLEQEKEDMKAKQTGLEEELRVKQEDLGKTKESLESSKLALHGAKVHLQVTEQSLREEYKRESSETYEVIKWLQHPQEGSAEYPSEKTTISALMDLCKYFRDENMETLERAAEEKQKIHASMKEADKRVKEMASTIAALKECIQVQDAEVRDLQAQLAPHQGMAVVPVPPPSDVADLTGDEVVLQQLCYMATGIKQLLIGPDGGTFKLGSGDASLEFPPGTVEMETSVRYAIILHGPFVFPAGYKPGSVVVYLNMDGATLVKPVLLYLSHWCLKKEGVDKDILKFFSTPHTLEAGQQVYKFEEQEKADFTTRSNVGVLTIQKPQCLYCVEAKGETMARYCAIKFSQNIPSEDTLLFMVQLMCDSLDWMEILTIQLQQKNWEKTSDKSIARFQYATGQQIVARLRRMTGPGWEATIDGHHAVVEQDFLQPMGKSVQELKREVTSGRFPPSIHCKVIYTSPEVERVKPALVIVDVDGANVPLSFSCRIKEEKISAQSVKVASSLSSPKADISNTAEVIGALKHDLDARWREFGTYVHVEPAIMDRIDGNNKSNVGACMLQLVENWLGRDNGTGDLPRTWKTVVQAVKNTGKGRLAEQLAEKYGVQPSGQ